MSKVRQLMGRAKAASAKGDCKGADKLYVAALAVGDQKVSPCDIGAARYEAQQVCKARGGGLRGARRRR